MTCVCSSVFNYSESKVLSCVTVMAAVFVLSGCGQYATKKDLTQLQQKVDAADLASLAERVEKIEKSTQELERRTEPQPQMTLDVKAVSVEDMAGLVKKIDELDNRLKSINATKKVALKGVSFPLGKFRIKDLSKAEMTKLKENAVRLKEEKPSTVEIITWSDSRGTPDKKEMVAGERAKNVAAYYRKKVGETSKIEFLTVYNVASVSGSFWRRADTTMWMTREAK